MGKFITQRGLSEIRRDADVVNSKVKRGDIKRHNTQTIAQCGCGRSGCTIHGSAPSTRIDTGLTPLSEVRQPLVESKTLASAFGKVLVPDKKA